MRKEAVYDNEEDELRTGRDECPEVEHSSGHEDARDEDIEDAAAFGNEPGRYGAAEQTDGVEAHDEVEALRFGNVDDRCAENGDLWGRWWSAKA